VSRSRASAAAADARIPSCYGGAPSADDHATNQACREQQDGGHLDPGIAPDVVSLSQAQARQPQPPRSPPSPAHAGFATTGGEDCGLFLVTRFREELHKQATVQDAVARTVATAGRSDHRPPRPAAGGTGWRTA
jgi:hypothetical protein